MIEWADDFKIVRNRAETDPDFKSLLWIDSTGWLRVDHVRDQEVPSNLTGGDLFVL